MEINPKFKDVIDAINIFHSVSFDNSDVKRKFNKLSNNEKLDLFKYLMHDDSTKNDVRDVRLIFEMHADKCYEYLVHNRLQLFNEMIGKGHIETAEWIVCNIAVPKIDKGSFGKLYENENIHALKKLSVWTKIDIDCFTDIIYEYPLTPVRVKIIEFLCESGFKLPNDFDKKIKDELFESWFRTMKMSGLVKK